MNAVDVEFNSSVCVTGDDFGLVKLFKFPSVKKGAKFKRYSGHSAHVTNVRFTADGRRVVTVGGADHAVFQWKVIGGQDAAAGDTNGLYSGDGMVPCVYLMQSVCIILVILFRCVSSDAGRFGCL